MKPTRPPREEEKAEKEITKQNTRVLVGFRNAYVFYGEQTEGIEFPAMCEVYGDVGQTTTVCLRFMSIRTSSLSLRRGSHSRFGMSYSGRIGILPGQSSSDTFATLVHQLARDVAQDRTTHHYDKENEAPYGAGVKVYRSTPPL